jgi:GNAT superfamily N-acetyltransferase
MEIAVLEWDSIFFNRTVARVKFSKEDREKDITKLIANCKIQGCQLVYLFADNTDEIIKDKLHKLLGYPINQKIVFTLATVLPEKIGTSQGAVYKIVNAAEIIKANNFYDKIFALTIKAGNFSRFKLDQKLGVGKFAEMYGIWVSKMLNDSNYRVIVAMGVTGNEDDINGFLAYKVLDDGYKIDFMSIDENCRQKGVGKALLKKMMEEINEKKGNYIVTEIHKDNIGAYNFFNINGFKVVEVVDIYHVHL